MPPSITRVGGFILSLFVFVAAAPATAQDKFSLEFGGSAVDGDGEVYVGFTVPVVDVVRVQGLADNMRVDTEDTWLGGVFGGSVSARVGFHHNRVSGYTPTLGGGYTFGLSERTGIRLSGDWAVGEADGFDNRLIVRGGVYMAF